jgi:acyl-CoA thioesterase FadM
VAGGRSDMDAYGQVNNVEVLRLLDETRSEIEYLRR